MHIEDLLVSFNGKIIAERNSNLASRTRACYCRYLPGAALNYILETLSIDDGNGNGDVRL